MSTKRFVAYLLGGVAASWLIAALPPAAGQPPKDDGDKPKPKNILEAIFGTPADTSGGAEDGSYTILLYICRSPTGHVEQAKYYKQATEKHVGWKNLFILHKDDHSLLYWGKYRTLDDARPNLKKAREYLTPAKIRLYALANPVALPGKGEDGPPEWKLDNLPPKLIYTVMIAEFYDVAEAEYIGSRKFAVDYCRELRGKGQEAYYRHDSASSVVTVGAFEASAVQFVRKPGSRDAAIIQQEIDDLVRNFPKLAPEVRAAMIRGIRERPNVEPQVRDPRITRILQTFPDLAVNGRQRILKVVNARTRQVERIPAPTSLIRIPRDSPNQPGFSQTRPADRPGNAEPREAHGNPAGPDRPAGRSDLPGAVPKS